MKPYYSNDPRIIICKFESYCKETGLVIKKGEQALYYPTNKNVYSLESKQAENYRNWIADRDLGHDY